MKPYCPHNKALAHRAKELKEKGGLTLEAIGQRLAGMDRPPFDRGTVSKWVKWAEINPEGTQPEDDVPWLFQPLAAVFSPLKEVWDRYQVYRKKYREELGDKPGITVLERRAYTLKQVARRRGMSVQEVVQALRAGEDESLQKELHLVGGPRLWR